MNQQIEIVKQYGNSEVQNTVMSLLYTPKKISILNFIVWALLGEELKAKAPPEETWNLGD